MSPMEMQVREHQMQLRRRLESIKRIHQATDTLEDRVSELEEVETTLMHYRSLIEAGHGDEDISTIFRLKAALFGDADEPRD